MSGNECEIPDRNPLSEEIKEVLENAKTIAIVGLSDKQERDSYKVASYLKEKGYKIIPVNPSKDEILGEKSYPDLKSIREKVDIVDVFRKIEAVPGIVDEAIELNPGTIWLQLGLAHRESAVKAEEAGIRFVQSKCLKIEHNKLIGG
jgi:predicted CoA-binding protein